MYHIPCLRALIVVQRAARLRQAHDPHRVLLAGGAFGRQLDHRKACRHGERSSRTYNTCQGLVHPSSAPIQSAYCKANCTHTSVMRRAQHSRSRLAEGATEAQTQAPTLKVGCLSSSATTLLHCGESREQGDVSRGGPHPHCPACVQFCKHPARERQCAACTCHTAVSALHSGVPNNTQENM